MKIYILTNNEVVKKAFEKMVKISQPDTEENLITFLPLPANGLTSTKNIESSIKETQNDHLEDRKETIYYIDISGFQKDKAEGLIKRITLKLPNHIGIIDPDMVITDITELFSCGVIDYIGRNLLEKGPAWKRMLKIIPTLLFLIKNQSTSITDEATLTNTLSSDYHHNILSTPLYGKNKKDRDLSISQQHDQYNNLSFSTTPSTLRGDNGTLLSGSNWSNIKDGSEYIFSLLFIELDLPQDWKKKSGKDHLQQIVKLFYSHIERTYTSQLGKIWMWTDYGGLLIFPFDGKTYTPVIESIRLMLNRTIISVEDYNSDQHMSWRIVHHIGKTVYQNRGNTGTIVSDAVNHIFHIGSQFTGAGNLCITEPLFNLLPTALMDCFTGPAKFEESCIYRLRRIIPAADGSGAI